eukprot:Skav205156  [mRNA]  locus=scaffold593:470948:479545:- [translate_table: standard]
MINGANLKSVPMTGCPVTLNEKVPGVQASFRWSLELAAAKRGYSCRIQIISEGDPTARELARILLGGKELEVCRRSLFIFSIRSCFRRRVIELVNWFLFDKFILSLILFNSLCLASYDYRSESDSGFNWISDNVFDPILTGFFTLEFVLKVIAFGFVLDKTSYLRDAWNWLDFIVVVTGILQLTPAMTSTEGVGFLRMPGT